MKNDHNKTNKIDLNYPKIVMKQLSMLKLSDQANRYSHSFFIGKNNLFPNLTICENFLFNSRIKEINEITNFASNIAQKRHLEETIINFQNFLPRQVPNEVIISSSFLSTLLRNTDIIIYTLTNVISEDDKNISLNITNQSTSTFINVDQNAATLDINHFCSVDENIKKAS